MSDTVTFSLTITKRLNDWLTDQAKNLGVSKNAQIIFFLEQLKKVDTEDYRSKLYFRYLAIAALLKILSALIIDDKRSHDRSFLEKLRSFAGDAEEELFSERGLSK